MSINNILITAIIVYLFALINMLWLKLEIKPRLLKYIKATHLILLPLILFPIIASIYRGSPVSYLGYYTLPIIFWGFLISGFLFFAFGFKSIKNMLSKSYFFLFQYLWLALAAVFAVSPLLGFFIIYMLKPLAQTHGNTVYTTTEYRIEEIGMGSFMAPRYKKLYYLVKKGSILETKTSFSLHANVDEMPTVIAADITTENNNEVLIAMEFKEDIIIDDSITSKKITRKISIK